MKWSSLAYRHDGLTVVSINLCTICTKKLVCINTTISEWHTMYAYMVWHSYVTRGVGGLYAVWKYHIYLFPPKSVISNLPCLQITMCDLWFIWHFCPPPPDICCSSRWNLICLGVYYVIAAFAQANITDPQYILIYNFPYKVTFWHVSYWKMSQFIKSRNKLQCIKN